MKTVIGVMGGSIADERTVAFARELGRLIAERGWVLLNGGRACGVMDASAAGASDAGGLCVGILPDDDSRQASHHLDVAIVTGLGDARNAVNVLSSRVVIACRGGAGTISEIALALAAGRPVVALDFPLDGVFVDHAVAGLLVHAATPPEAIAHVERFLREGA